MTTSTTAFQITTRELPEKFLFVRKSGFLYAIPALNAEDRDAIGIVMGFDDQEYTSVTYMADCIGLARETLNRRLSDLVRRNFLEKVVITKNRVKYILSNAMRMVQARYEKQAPEESDKPAATPINTDCDGTITPTVTDPSHNKINTDIKDLIGRKETPQETCAEVPIFSKEKRFRAFVEKFGRWWDFEGMENPVNNSIADYMDHAETKGYLPSYAGCERHLQREIDIYHRNLETRFNQQQLQQAKSLKSQGLTVMFEQQAMRVHADNTHYRAA